MLRALCRCGSILKNLEFPGCKASQCEACGYLFLPKEYKEEAFSAVERKFTETILEDLEQTCHTRRDKLLLREEGEVLYRNCPECNEQMARKNFGHVSGVIVHECMNHGIAGDIGWLEQAQDFIRKGGEILVLRSQLEQMREEIGNVKADANRRIDQMKRAGYRHGIILFPL